MKPESKPAVVLTDEQIVDLYWQRDEKAIRESDAKYGKYLLSVAYNIVHDASDSEECLNDTYLGAWNAIPPAKPDSLRAFLTVIMRRTAIDRYKASKRQKRIASELTVSLSEIEDLIVSDETADSENAEALSRVISDFVRSLPDRRMYIFMSRYYTVRPVREIAGLLGCSESTVNKEIATIKRDLKEKLAKEGFFYERN